MRLPTPAPGLAIRPPSQTPVFQIFAQGVILAILFFYVCCSAVVMSLKSHNPPLTVLMIQRTVEAYFTHKPYLRQYDFVPINVISPNLQYAVIASEDTRFYVHRGFDTQELARVAKRDIEKRKLDTGAPTITQQLIENLFLGTARSLFAKAIEFTLVPIVETLIPKERILELYLNVAEFGPGIFGAQPAAMHWFRQPASALTRDQAARLAAVIPNPLRLSPASESIRAGDIEFRMHQMGW